MMGRKFISMAMLIAAMFLFAMTVMLGLRGCEAAWNFLHLYTNNLLTIALPVFLAAQAGQKVGEKYLKNNGK